MPLRDDHGGRDTWFRRSRGGRSGLPGEVFLRAATSRAAADDRVPSAAPGLPGTVNWVPLGPHAVTGGQASGSPVVSGRIEGLAVGPGGQRVYVGTAAGGAWFSPDAGTTWEPLDEFAVTAGPQVPNRTANSLSVGALAVTFGADRGADQVYVGTGQHRAFHALFGIGVRVSTSGGADGSWQLEATNLAGQACLELAIDPDDPTLVLAATTGGLFRRPATNRSTWTTVTSPAFTAAAGVVSDVLIAGSTAAGSKTYYAAFLGDGVYASPDLTTWTRVPGPGPVAADGRIVLAASETDPTVVYAFCQSRALYRLTAGSFRAVTGVPRNIFGLVGGTFQPSGGYNIVLAVDPAARDTIYLGGSIVWDQAPTDAAADWNLALFRGTVTTPTTTPAFPFTAANTATAFGVFAERNDATYVGRGIHPDAQSFAFSRRADNAGLDPTGVWVGCDGGLFRSTTSGALGTFTACNTGLGTSLLTFLAGHPTLESVALAGAQDNGTLRWRSGPVWHEPQPADGGGVAIDANNPYRMMRQFIQATLDRSVTGGATRAAWTSVAFPPATANTAAQTLAVATERSASAFYSPIVTTPVGTVPTLVAKGSDRAWVSPDWGATWATVPTGSNPYAAAVPSAAQDAIGQVVALAFPAATRLFAATATRVFSFTQAGGTWTPNPPVALPAIPGVAPSDPITAIASAGGQTLYATVGGSGVDHCWYFDGTAWFGTGLLGTVDVPASTVTIDPGNPTTVFVGTDVGVYRSTRSGTAHAAWALHSDGLPEAAVLHLEVHQPSRTLRAATHGRGAWELPLDPNAVPHPELFLRMNVGDNGRRLPGADGGGHPDTPGAVLARAASPDIRIRRGVAVAAPPAFPGTLLRLRRPARMRGPDVLQWQQGAADRGFSFPSGVDGVFGPETDTVCRELQKRFGLAVDGIVGPITWPATFAYPRLADSTSALAVELATPDALDPAGSGATLADSAGQNRIFVEVHSRSPHPVSPADLVVVLLFADDAGALPQLPADHATRVRGRDTTGWLAGSGWVFARPGAPYAPVPRPLSAASPQVVEYVVDFSTVGIPSKNLMALALVSTSTGADPLTSAERSVLTLVRTERRSAATRLLLVP